MNTNYDFPVELQPIFLSNGKKIENRKAVVRTDSMNTLGVVSDEYGLVKHATVIDSFREAGKEFNVQEKITLAKDGAYLYYQMTFPTVQMEVKKDDIVKLMMIVKNSYNGANSLQIVCGAFRLVCENGLIIGTKFMQFSYRHVGNVGGINDSLMVEQYKEAYKNYVSMFAEKSNEISQMTRIAVLSLDNGIFDQKNVSLPKYLLEEAEEKYENGDDHTLWGYYNSLTYAITHKIKSSNPGLAITYGVEAWKAVQRLW